MSDVIKVDIDDAGMPNAWKLPSDDLTICSTATCTAITPKFRDSGTDDLYNTTAPQGVSLGDQTLSHSWGYLSTGQQLGSPTKTVPSFRFLAFTPEPDASVFTIVKENGGVLFTIDGHGNLEVTGNLVVNGEIRSDTPCNVSIIQNMEFYPLFMLIAVGFLWQRKQIKLLNSALRAQRATVRAAP